MKKLILALFIFYAVSNNSYALRNNIKKPIVHTVTIKFNGETIKGYFTLIDTRTNEEIISNIKNHSIEGSVIIFFQGHAQRPDDAFKFTSELSRQSKSGIVIIPVCDTPYGINPHLRGDAGKIIILMEIVRYALSFYNMDVNMYEPHKEIIMVNNATIPIKDDSIKVNTMAVGWSHGALLARMFSCKYPSVTKLVQICPAGYLQLYNNKCISSCCLTSSFLWESIRISTNIFTGHASDVFSAGWGVTKGIVGDTCRSCNSCFTGNFTFLKLFRSYKDIQDATILETGKNYPVNNNVSSIVVIFANNDSLFNPSKILHNSYTTNPNPEYMDAFFKNYFPEANNSARMHLFILPGKHIAPIIYYKEYVLHVLEYTGERRL